MISKETEKEIVGIIRSFGRWWATWNFVLLVALFAAGYALVWLFRELMRFSTLFLLL